MKKIILGISILVISIISIIVLISVKEQKDIIARYVTDENYRYKPVELNGDVYFPSSIDLGNEKNLKSIGYLSVKDKNIVNDLLLIVGKVFINENDKDYTHFSVVDDFAMNYTKGSYLQDKNIINDNMNKYNDFVLCNDKNDIEIRTTIEKDILYMLQNEFKTIEYKVDDFKNCDDRYYIYVNSPQEKLYDRTFDNPIIFMGCILNKDNNFYYGNLDNEIKGELLNKIITYIE